MTELAIREEAPAPVTPAPMTGALAAWYEEARAANALAKAVCNTSFVPEHFRGKPEEATAAILTGHELGFSPMASLASIFIIKGRPGMYARAMVALVESKGHEVWVESQSDDEVVVCGKRKGSTNVHRTVWNRERVVKAKLVGNAKYQESPQQMMAARGQAEIARQVAPDALLGIAYAVEELEDMEPVRAEVIQTPAKKLTSAEIMGAPARDPEPAEEEESDELWSEVTS